MSDWVLILGGSTGHGAAVAKKLALEGYGIISFHLDRGEAKKIAQKKKLFMHFVVIFGLIVFFGGLDFLRSIFNDKAFDNIWADITKLVMLITGGFFSYICFKYFMHVRKNKKFES